MVVRLLGDRNMDSNRFGNESHAFTYKTLTHPQITQSGNMRAAYRMLWSQIDREFPDGPEKTEAYKRLVESYWWILEAIRRAD